MESKIITLNAALIWRGHIETFTVETQVTDGIGIHLIGLPDAAVKEILLRVATAMQSCSYILPGRKVIINVAPADGRGSGRPIFHRHGVCSALDLPIALGIILASGQIQAPAEDLSRTIFIGELGLDGSLRCPDTGLIHPEDAARVTDTLLSRDFWRVCAWSADDVSPRWRGVSYLYDITEDIRTGKTL